MMMVSLALKEGATRISSLTETTLDDELNASDPHSYQAGLDAVSYHPINSRSSPSRPQFCPMWTPTSARRT
eukprot:COSAG03_NODE_826_length_5714_cov_1.809083_4_plen_71_part_00